MFIYPLNSLPLDKYSLAGGKARSLAYMMQNTSMRIPEGYVINCDALEGTRLRAEADNELRELLNNLSDRSSYAIR